MYRDSSVTTPTSLIPGFLYLKIFKMSYKYTGYLVLIYVSEPPTICVWNFDDSFEYQQVYFFLRLYYLDTMKL